MMIESKIKNYTVEMIDDFQKEKKSIFSDVRYNNVFYFIDRNVWSIYGEKLKKIVGDDNYLLIDALEENKEFTRLSEYYSNLIDSNFKRNDLLFTIGGGILQDISGFIASTLYRGVQWVFLPTTLLSQADSCIGSKTSINFKDSKNLVGSFYPPDKIFIDIHFNQTLTQEYFNSGLGEIIKFHLLSNTEGYTFLKRFLSSNDLRNSELLKDVIWSTLQIKQSYFESDEFDSGRRNLLNYGHCFGHALESASNFSICHGEAVLLGMGFANLLSLKRGIITRDKYMDFEELLKKYYPAFDFSTITVEDLIYYLKRDKKRVGKDLTMILAKDVGQHSKYNDIKEKEIIETYQDFIRYFNDVSGIEYDKV